MSRLWPGGPPRWRVAVLVAVAAALTAVVVACVATPRTPPRTGPSAGESRTGLVSGHPAPGPPRSGSAGDGSASPGPTGSAGQLGSPVQPGSSSKPAPAAGWWRPPAGASWQWQLTGTLDRGVAADVYDVDAVTTSTADVAALHAAGRRVICYVNVGAVEDFRTDAGRFPSSVRGRELDGWPGEHWLDIRRWDVLAPLLDARFGACRAKGFDGVEPDNVDAYDNPSGFPLTASDQLAYNRLIAELAHRHGLAVGLKNDVEQAAALAPQFDFAVNEECAKYRECAELSVFVRAGKPVFHVEYDLATDQFCASTKAMGFSSMRKKLDLDAWRQPC